VSALPAIPDSSPKSGNGIPWLAFAGMVSVTLALFLFPAIVIQPFRFQSAQGLMRAVAVRQEAPLWTLLTAGAAFLVALVLWWRISRWQRVIVATGLCLASAAAVMARIDYFEWMFHPVTVAGFESVGSSKLDPAEMVMAVRFAADARAYPIFEMAYHHVLNDVVGGVPIAVTY
jgi:hypothetical protein